MRCRCPDTERDCRRLGIVCDVEAERRSSSPSNQPFACPQKAGEGRAARASASGRRPRRLRRMALPELPVLLLCFFAAAANANLLHFAQMGNVKPSEMPVAFTGPKEEQALVPFQDQVDDTFEGSASMLNPDDEDFISASGDDEDETSYLDTFEVSKEGEVKTEVLEGIGPDAKFSNAVLPKELEQMNETMVPETPQPTEAPPKANLQPTVKFTCQLQFLASWLIAAVVLML